MMQFMSEILLRREIADLEAKEDLNEDNKIWLSLCKRELMILERLKVEEIDIQGDFETLQKRLDQYSVYFLNKEEYNQMCEKAARFDVIQTIMSREF